MQSNFIYELWEENGPRFMWAVLGMVLCVSLAAGIHSYYAPQTCEEAILQLDLDSHHTDIRMRSVMNDRATMQRLCALSNSPAK